jgi:hypothetical protein
MDAGGVASGLEQGKAPGVPVGEEGAAGKAVAIACDPMAVAVVPNIEMMGRANALRSEIGHCE